MRPHLFYLCVVVSRITMICYHNGPLRGLPNMVGNLIEIVWLKKAYREPQFTGICEKNRGVRFHRIRDVKQYYFSSSSSSSSSRTTPAVQLDDPALPLRPPPFPHRLNEYLVLQGNIPLRSSRETYLHGINTS